MLYLSGLVAKSPEGVMTMGAVAVGVVAAGLMIGVVFTRVAGTKVRQQAEVAEKRQDPDALPEQ